LFFLHRRSGPGNKRDHFFYCFNGKKATLKLFNEILKAGKPGDKITISFTHREINNTIVVTAGKKTTRSFEMKSVPDPTIEQAAILDRWLK